MKRLVLLGITAGILCTAGCTSHLVFIEESHTGLRIRAGGNSAPSPYEISLGYRRGMIAAVPKQQNAQAVDAGSTTDRGVAGGETNRENMLSTLATSGSKAGLGNGSNGKARVVLRDDPTELMSLYSEFCANVGFNDPVEYHNLLVTGDAAIWLLADGNSRLRDALGDVTICAPKIVAAPANNTPATADK